MRTFASLLLVSGLVIGCGGGRQHGDGTDGGGHGADACVGLQCQVADCSKMGGTPTSISGTVFAPNGTLALYGATVYVPNIDPGPLPTGLQCDRCTGELPGEPIARAISDEAGHFRLDNVPSGTDVPLIVQIGKWRRKVLIPSVTSCTDNPQPANLTSLPRNKSEGDMPQIAITTGNSDALECLIKRLGVGDSEFSTNAGAGHIHLYDGNGASMVQTAGGAVALPAAPTLWNDINQLSKYDIVMFSCEGSQNPATKSQAAMNAVKQYADMGGRVFLSHYHNIWIGGETGNTSHAPAVWPTIAACSGDGYDDVSDVIDTVNNPKGSSFQQWMQNVMGSTTPGQIPIQAGTARQTCTTIDNAKAERWVYTSGTNYAQDFQFTTPNEMPADQRCGKVVFSDMHVAGDSRSTGTFPSGCSTTPLSPQEKALAFMFFDIASCVQVIQ